MIKKQYQSYPRIKPILNPIVVASPCGLYYKHVTIVNDDSSIVSK